LCQPAYFFPCSGHLFDRGLNFRHLSFVCCQFIFHFLLLCFFFFNSGSSTFFSKPPFKPSAINPPLTCRSDLLTPPFFSSNFPLSSFISALILSTCLSFRHNSSCSMVRCCKQHSKWIIQLEILHPVPILIGMAEFCVCFHFEKYFSTFLQIQHFQ